MPQTTLTPPDRVHAVSRVVGFVCFSEERIPRWGLDELMPHVGSKTNAVPDKKAASEKTVATNAKFLGERLAMNLAVQV
eukprot:CAMPEP_0172733084 /NCGR_PEP_ID=MMETSP1074-20121228/106104_1 /TAXON_ID=2916 /ORGANISM="Ceratium fusus, Strain PA161109" /LENGTH=78 /DNA_ID=CAMNT_0013561519 /DNA_START=184 /DNA_END=420 /DNA_ORIENTATION=+